jgi:hypothetical protein
MPTFVTGIGSQYDQIIPRGLQPRRLRRERSDMVLD